MHRKWLFGCLLSILPFLPLCGQEAQDEIVIEMSGEESAPRVSVSIWDKNARQLTKLFRKKDRTYVLYHVENVSSKDDILSSKDGKEYAYVRYGSDDGNYRKFLFKAEDPQTFLVAAANIDDVLAVNKKYKVNLGVDREDFLRRYGSQATLKNLSDNANGKTYRAYKINYSDINNKQPSVHYFVFEGNALVETLAGEKEFNSFLDKLSDSNQQLTQKQQATAKNQRQQTAQKRTVRKALVSGGTVKDQMYMPRAVNAKPLPPLTPSNVPAGTPL